MSVGIALGAALALSGCEWFTDFKEQPSVRPWESKVDSVPPRANPQFSVPIGGTTVAAFQVSYAATPPTVDSMSGLVNPVPVSDSSLENGRKYYAINCAVCHGDTGAGNGPATRYGMAGISLLTPTTQNRTDGYIWGMIRNGRGLMPPYNRIEDMDRWDVVNYVRGLQGRLGRQVPVGPVAPPGVTGDAMPGPTRLAPQHPNPHNVTLRADVARTGAQPTSGTAGPAAVPGTPAAAGQHQQPAVRPLPDSGAAATAPTPRPRR